MQTDPLALFSLWLGEAEDAEPNDPNAMAVATTGADGQPSVRMVLLKEHGQHGFVFYTNLESRKGTQIAERPFAALLFHWKSLRRQVRIEGKVHRVEDAVADAYFASRPRDSQLGAWASDQSRPMASRAAFESRLAEMMTRFGDGPIPRPPHWSGLCVFPDRIEFWTDREFRLHERRVFVREGGDWKESLLFP
jgi:pyridoxamine 5'-phosphate oxidase